MPALIEQRRWTRLNPEILMPCRVRIVGTRVDAELRDLSPGGIGLTLPPCFPLPTGESISLRVKFSGQPEVVREGIVRGFDAVTGNLGVAWPFEPDAWDGLERRGRSRVHLPQDALFARLPLRHAHRLWSRLRIVDLSSDLGFQVETLGGPGYLLPGHRAPFHLDIPLLTGKAWEAQVLWCRSGIGQGVRMGLRILDPDPDLATALGEWLELDRHRSPLDLQELGFRKAVLEGQFRFRKVEESGEKKEVDLLLDLPPQTEGIRIGVWDGHLLVGGALLLLEEGSNGSCRVSHFHLRREWVVPDVFFGPWEQVVRHFLASGTAQLSMACPPGREHLFALAGLNRSIQDVKPEWRMSRRSVMWARSMNLVRWHILYAEVGAFTLKHMDSPVRWQDRLVRWSKIAAWNILRDWREPVELGRLRREIERWAADLER
jgi:hypothetical protein